MAISRAHAHESVRLACEIRYYSPSWKRRYGHRNLAESLNSVLERPGLNRLPVDGLASCRVTVLQGETSSLINIPWPGLFVTRLRSGFH